MLLKLILITLSFVSTAQAFNVVYTDRQNIQWGPNIAVTDQMTAQDLCKKLGARLPSVREYQILIGEFDNQYDYRGPTLTQLGQLQMQKVFSDMYPVWFWTSTRDYRNKNSAGIFDNYFSHACGAFTDVSNKAHVRCVRSQ